MSNKFYVIIVLRVLLLLFSGILFSILLIRLDRPLTLAFFALLLLIQTVELVRFLMRINRDLSNFLLYITEKDSTLSLSKARVSHYFGGVPEKLESILQDIRESRIKNEQKEFFLQVVVEHTVVGLIAYDESGRISFANQSARDLFKIPSLNRLTQLTEKFAVLDEILNSANPQENKLVQIQLREKKLDLAVKTSTLRFEGNTLRLVSFQDIQYELDAKEVESWRKLIRILRHEIMNSITPIITLSAAMRRQLNGDKNLDVAENSCSTENKDLLRSIELIEERSKGLVSFVEKFKNLTQLPNPVYSFFSMEDLTNRILGLFHEEMERKEIKWEFGCTPQNINLFGDKELLEQVLVNLVKNALEADPGPQGSISIMCKYEGANQIIIRVKDTGRGIPDENIGSIFIPSFTTKKNGSGIGLSLSKQIIQLHQGSIHVQSKPGAGTEVEIRLPVPEFLTDASDNK